VPLADLDYGWQEEYAVLRVIRRRGHIMGGITQELDERFTAASCVPCAFGVSNSAVGLHLVSLA
jgi:hypothetical protein